MSGVFDSDKSAQSYVELVQRMTREEMIVYQLEKRAQEAIDQAYYDEWLKTGGYWRDAGQGVGQWVEPK